MLVCLHREGATSTLLHPRDGKWTSTCGRNMWPTWGSTACYLGMLACPTSCLECSLGRSGQAPLCCISNLVNRAGSSCVATASQCAIKTGARQSPHCHSKRGDALRPRHSANLVAASLRPSAALGSHLPAVVMLVEADAMHATRARTARVRMTYANSSSTGASEKGCTELKTCM